MLAPPVSNWINLNYVFFRDFSGSTFFFALCQFRLFPTVSSFVIRPIHAKLLFLFWIIIFAVKIVQSSVQHKRALISLEPENPKKPKKLNPREIDSFGQWNRLIYTYITSWLLQNVTGSIQISGVLSDSLIVILWLSSCLPWTRRQGHRHGTRPRRAASSSDRATELQEIRVCLCHRLTCGNK